VQKSNFELEDSTIFNVDLPSRTKMTEKNMSANNYHARMLV
jgi:hypothetical protein